MESEIIIVTGIALVIGMIAGALLHKTFHAGSAKNRRLESQIDQLNDRHTHYQAEVNSHFSKTAELLGKLNADYQKVFNHLAKGAERLGSDTEFRTNVTSKLEQNHRPATENKALLAETKYADPPRDYAPKSDPEDKGMLAEDFGLPSKIKNPNE